MFEIDALTPREHEALFKKLDGYFASLQKLSKSAPDKTKGDIEVQRAHQGLTPEQIKEDLEAKQSLKALTWKGKGSLGEKIKEYLTAMEQIVGRTYESAALRQEALAVFDECCDHIENLLEAGRQKVTLEAQDSGGASAEQQFSEFESYLRRNILGGETGRKNERADRLAAMSGWRARIDDHLKLKQALEDAEAGADEDAKKKARAKYEAFTTQALVWKKLSQEDGLATNGDIVGKPGQSYGEPEKYWKDTESFHFKSEFRRAKTEVFSCSIDCTSNWMGADDGELLRHIERGLTMAIANARRQAAELGEPFDMKKVKLTISGMNLKAVDHALRSLRSWQVALRLKANTPIGIKCNA